MRRYFLGLALLFLGSLVFFGLVACPDTGPTTEPVIFEPWPERIPDETSPEVILPERTAISEVSVAPAGLPAATLSVPVILEGVQGGFPRLFGVDGERWLFYTEPDGSLSQRVLLSPEKVGPATKINEFGDAWSFASFPDAHRLILVEREAKTALIQLFRVMKFSRELKQWGVDYTSGTNRNPVCPPPRGGVFVHGATPRSFFLSYEKKGVVSCTTHTMMYSHDGQLWKNVSPELRGAPLAAIAKEKRIVLITDWNVYVSDDGGKHFFPQKDYPHSILFAAASAIYAEPSILAISSTSSPPRLLFWRSDDEARSWKRSSIFSTEGYRSINGWSLEHHGAHLALLVHTSSHTGERHWWIIYSNDLGQTWSQPAELPIAPYFDRGDDRRWGLFVEPNKAWIVLEQKGQKIVVVTASW